MTAFVDTVLNGMLDDAAARFDQVHFTPRTVPPAPTRSPAARMLVKTSRGTQRPLVRWTPRTRRHFRCRQAIRSGLSASGRQLSLLTRSWVWCPTSSPVIWHHGASSSMLRPKPISFVCPLGRIRRRALVNFFFSEKDNLLSGLSNPISRTIVR